MAGIYLSPVLSAPLHALYWASSLFASPPRTYTTQEFVAMLPREGHYNPLQNDPPKTPHPDSWSSDLEKLAAKYEFQQPFVNQRISGRQSAR